MTELDNLLGDIRSHVTEIAMHIAHLPKDEEVPDETYVKLVTVFERNIQYMFDILDKGSSTQNNMGIASESISEVVRMLRFDLNPNISSLINAADITYERFASQLSTEQKESLLSIEKLSEALLAHLRALADYDAQYD